MATTSSRLGQRLAASTDSANFVTDAANNFSLIDAAIGAVSATSSARPSSPFTGMIIRETDTKNVLIWNGTGWQHTGVPVVSATAQILVPYTGQVILLTTDNLLYRYTGSAWVTLTSGGDGSGTASLAVYDQSTVQSVANNTDDYLLFQTAVTTTVDLEATSTSLFTIKKAGTWHMVAQAAWANNATGFRDLNIVDGSNANLNWGTGQAVATDFTTHQVSTIKRFALNATVRVLVSQNSGGALSTSINSWGSKCRFSAVYLGA